MNNDIKHHNSLKTLALGFALGLSVALGVAAVTNSSNDVPGRFTIGATDNHAIILDTATGAAWSYYFKSSGGAIPSHFFEPKGK